MEKARIGKTNIETSVLCMGTDSMGSTIDEAASFQLLDYFAQMGGTFIDTANFYAAWADGCEGGESETIIGRWMKQRANRDRMVIASKLGFEYSGCGGGLRAGEIEREVERSLERLQTDRIDLYYAHRDDFHTPLEETMEAFDRLVKAGKVRAVGASNLSVWRIAEANTLSRLRGWAQYCAIEQRYTYLRPRHGADFGPQICISQDLKDYCKCHGITLVAYSILLKGAYTRDDRRVPAQFAGPQADERMATLRAVADETGATMNQVIIAWMLQSDPRVLPIVAASRVVQLKETMASLEFRLSEDQMSRLDTAGNPDIKEAWLR